MSVHGDLYTTLIVIVHFKFIGTVELENLPLRKTALQGLELPLEVKSGFIGRLKLSIPFRHPKSEPWIIHIDKLYLIAGPLSHYQVQINTDFLEEYSMCCRKQLQLLLNLRFPCKSPGFPVSLQVSL